MQSTICTHREWTIMWMWHFRECQHHDQPCRIIPHQYLRAHGGGLEIPNPEFALSWQGKRLIRTHTPLRVTLPASLAQHATLDLNGVFFSLLLPFAECAAMYELRLKCVTDLIRRECFLRRGAAAAAAAPFSLEPREGPVKWFDACCMGPLSAEHWVTHGSTSRGIKSTLLFAACQTAARAA